MHLDITSEALEIEEIYTDAPTALLIDGPCRGKIVPVNGPFEKHFEEGHEYVVVSRGDHTWQFPIRYRLARGMEVGS